jgi:hypothetical protein
MKKEIFLIKDVLKNIINSYEYKNGLKISLLNSQWKNIIGEKLFNHTQPDKILKKTLYIKCSHTGWVSTLQFYKKDIINNIMNMFPDDFDISGIIFFYGKIENKSRKIDENNIENTEKNRQNDGNEIYENLLKKLNSEPTKNE